MHQNELQITTMYGKLMINLRIKPSQAYTKISIIQNTQETTYPNLFHIGYIIIF